ncbi:hypothetical protein BC828DRAFT_385937 [Blastocladiella britannica]|nr:hypothetical protein BC828DRAFT_385937 [Blastocladiella britannica]
MSSTTTQTPTVKPNNVSGRPWKEPGQRVSAMRPRSLKPYAQRMAELQSIKLAKEQEMELRDAKKREAEAHRQRRRENEERRKINSLKSEIVQSVSSRRVKRMTKKQLLGARIEMRATGLIPAIREREDRKTAEYQAEQRAAKAAAAAAAAATTKNE